MQVWRRALHRWDNSQSILAGTANGDQSLDAIAEAQRRRLQANDSRADAREVKSENGQEQVCNDDIMSPGKKMIIASDGQVIKFQVDSPANMAEELDYEPLDSDDDDDDDVL